MAIVKRREKKIETLHQLLHIAVVLRNSQICQDQTAGPQEQVAEEIKINKFDKSGTQTFC